MPHICTACQIVLDARADLLKGCPNCGARKFQFVKGDDKSARAPWPEFNPGRNSAKAQKSPELWPEETIINSRMGVLVPPRLSAHGSSSKASRSSLEIAEQHKGHERDDEEIVAGAEAHLGVVADQNSNEQTSASQAELIKKTSNISPGRLKEEERTEKWTEEGVERSEGRIEGREGFPKGWAEAERTRKSEKGVVPSISREEKSAKVGRISTILSGAEAEAQSAKPTSSDQKTEGEAKDSSQPPIESIRISEPGSYEINLPSLFERDSLVMSMREGTYLIDLATAFKKPKKE